MTPYALLILLASGSIEAHVTPSEQQCYLDRALLYAKATEITVSTRMRSHLTAENGERIRLGFAFACLPACDEQEVCS